VRRGTQLVDVRKPSRGCWGLYKRKRAAWELRWNGESNGGYGAMAEILSTDATTATVNYSMGMQIQYKSMKTKETKLMSSSNFNWEKKPIDPTHPLILLPVYIHS